MTSRKFLARTAASERGRLFLVANKGGMVAPCGVISIARHKNALMLHHCVALTGLFRIETRADGKRLAFER